MTVEVCPGCGERFHLFEGDDQICTKCLPTDLEVYKPPTAGPPVAVVEGVVKGKNELDTDQ